MRVESMDAININLDKSNNHPIVSKEDKDIKSSLREKKSISQMTDVDRRILPVEEQVLINAIERANKAMAGSARRFEISIHEKTKNVMVKVIDSETDQLVREIPPEKILDLIAKLWEMAGLIVDERR